MSVMQRSKEAEQLWRVMFTGHTQENVPRMCPMDGRYRNEKHGFLDFVMLNISLENINGRRASYLHHQTECAQCS
jgi:hypothetical protein